MVALTKADFLSRWSISQVEFDSSGLVWDDLERLFEEYNAIRVELEKAGHYVAQLLQQVPEVHSYKVRVKDPEHLLEKIIRKKIQHPSREYTRENYQDQVRDLVGVRALHLLKDGWKSIHDFVLGTWCLCEKPIAYVREGDSPEFQAQLAGAGLEVKEHDFGYRSLHYVLGTSPTKVKRNVELQVRTIFEEGWSEIDHLVRYPSYSDDESLKQFLQIFNRLAGSADEMGTFVSNLNARLREQDLALSTAQANITRLEDELRDAISKSKISDKEKRALKKKVEELRAASTPLPFGFTPANEGLFRSLDLSGLQGSSGIGKGITLADSSMRAGNLQGFLPDVTGINTSLFNRAECEKCGREFTSQPFASLVSGGRSLCPNCQSKD